VVWLRDGATWLPAALSGTASAGPVGAAGDGLPRVEGADLTVPVRHGDELLGAVTVTKAGPGPLTPLERRLVVDLAAHAGIATTTLRLHQRLRRRLEVSRRQQQELIASRAQVIAAHDAERRRLERDIHDSCQQPAVVLAGRLGLAGAVAHRDPDQALAAVDTAYADLTRLAAALDRLVGAAPLPELAAAGIAAALRAETASLPVPVEVDDRTGGRRHRPEIEAEVYFCCTEAIQNATRHARPSRITVQLTEQHGWLTVRINDDGAGFDPDRAGTDRTGTDTDHAGTGAGLRNMRERLRRCGGRLAIRSSPAGTEVSAEIPAAAGGAGA
jgi:signal transduction histidine kinase